MAMLFINITVVFIQKEKLYRAMKKNFFFINISLTKKTIDSMVQSLWIREGILHLLDSTCGGDPFTEICQCL